MGEPAQATKACPLCGETVLAVAIKCKHCGSVIDEGAMATIRNPPEAVGAILLLLPFVAAIGMWLWVSNLTLLDKPLDVMSGIIFAVVVLSTVLMAVDASLIKSSKGDGPNIGTTIALGLLLWVVGYPAYMSMRSKFGAKNLVVGAIFAMLLFLGVYALLYFAIDSKLDEVRRAMSQ
jgi:hypothetical protein